VFNICESYQETKRWSLTLTRLLALSRSVLFNFSAHIGFSLAKAFTDCENHEENEQKQEK